MRADQSVGRGAADEIAAGDQQEIARAQTGAERGERDAQRTVANKDVEALVRTAQTPALASPIEGISLLCNY
jgi:hypothetical protein